ncbi:MAG: DUF296 domain-containing protein [Kiloniellales bacterium]
MRQARHPGPSLEPRRLNVKAASAGEYRLQLGEGEELHAGLLDALADLGLAHAAITLVSGRFAAFSYLTGQPDKSGARLATYGAPCLLAGPVTLIGANALVGSSVEGAPLLHCHAVVVDAEGRVHGGHLPPGACFVGAGGLVAQVLGLSGGGFAVAYDAETNYPIFHPKVIAEVSA